MERIVLVLPQGLELNKQDCCLEYGLCAQRDLKIMEIPYDV